jgi:hypothetical protein
MEANFHDTVGKTEDEIVANIQMVVQVQLYRAQRGRFDAAHLRLFSKLAAEPSFMGSLKCRVAVERKEVEKHLQELQVELACMGQTNGMEVDGRMEETGAAAMLDPGTIAVDTAEVTADAHHWGADMAEDDEGDEARDEVVAGLLYQISMLTTDNMLQDRAEE